MDNNKMVYDTAKRLTCELLSIIGSQMAGGELVRGIRDGIEETHRYHQAVSLPLLLRAVAEFGDQSQRSGRYDARNVRAVELAQKIHETLREV